MSDNNESIDHLSFEDAIKKLESIVKNLETGKNSLDFLMENYEYASKLKQHCAKILEEAKAKIQIINQNGQESSINIDFGTNKNTD